MPPATPHHHQSGVGQDAQVLHDGEAAQLRHRIGQVAGGPRTLAQQVEQLPTLRAGQHPPDIRLAFPCRDFLDR